MSRYDVWNAIMGSLIKSKGLHVTKYTTSSGGCDIEVDLFDAAHSLTFCVKLHYNENTELLFIRRRADHEPCSLDIAVSFNDGVSSSDLVAMQIACVCIERANNRIPTPQRNRTVDLTFKDLSIEKATRILSIANE